MMRACREKKKRLMITLNIEIAGDSAMERFILALRILDRNGLHTTVKHLARMTAKACDEEGAAVPLGIRELER
jgi:hypothetical protein